MSLEKALVRDYLLLGNAYAYINKQRNSLKSLHYVNCKNVTVNQNFEPIFKGAWPPWTSREGTKAQIRRPFARGGNCAEPKIEHLAAAL